MLLTFPFGTIRVKGAACFGEVNMGHNNYMKREAQTMCFNSSFNSKRGAVMYEEDKN